MFPIDKKGGAHEALYLLFQQDVVPPKMIVDGSKEQTLGYFKRKDAEAGYHMSHTELEYPWQMATKGGIRELKRWSGRKMTRNEVT